MNITAADLEATTILHSVEDFLARYIVLDSSELRILALWTLHTYQFSESCTRPNVTPYIYVKSAQKGSGKTLVIDVLETLVRNPVRATDMSVATLFRLIETISPTVMLDEIDTVFNGAKNDELKGAVNGGYRQGGHVWRTEALEPRKFSTFGAKLLAGIDNLLMPDTTRDRCIPITLRRATREELDTVRPFYHYEVEDEAAALAERIHDWSQTVTLRLRDYRPEVIRELSPRQWEVSMPLVSMAHICGCKDEVRVALTRVLTAQEVSTTIEQDLLALIRQAFDSDIARGDKIIGTDLLAYLADKDPRFGGLSGKGLANKLTPFGAKPGTIRLGNNTYKGYLKSGFADAWERYL
jgi:hypothetical protein